MKKLLLLIMALIVVLSMIACDETATTNEDGDGEGTETTVQGQGGTVITMPDGTVVTMPDGTAATYPSDDGIDKGESDTGNSQKPGTGNSQNPGTGNSQNPGTDNTQTDSSTGKPDDSTQDKDPIVVPSGDGLKLIQAVVDQLEKAGSLKFKVTLDVSGNQTVWDSDEYGNPYAQILTMDMKVDAVVTVARGANGFNLRLDLDMDATIDTPLDSAEYYSMKGDYLYIIDGVMYEYDKEDECYYASPVEDVDMTELEAILAEMLAGIEISEEEMNLMLDAVGTMVIQAFGIENGKGTATVDFKAMYDEVVGFINDLDLSKTTLRGILDEVLALVDPAMTTEALVQSLAATMNMTVGEYLVYFEQSYGMTVQEMYDSLINDPKVQAIIIAMVAPPTATEEEIAQFIAQLASYNVEQIFTPEIQKLTMYEFALVLFEADIAEQPTLAELVQYINVILDMTFEELEVQMGIPFSAIKMIPSLLTVRACDFKVDLTLNKNFGIGEICAEANVDVTVMYPSDYANGRMDSASLKAEFGFMIYDISDEPVEIKLPEDAVIK